MQAYPAALERIKKWEAHVRREAPGNFFVVPSTFLALQVQSVVLVSAFVWSVQFDQFFVFLSLLSVPPCPVICKTGGRATVPYGWSQRHFRGTVSRQKAL